jgi:glycosyltransferase 2 family protein
MGGSADAWVGFTSIVPAAPSRSVERVWTALAWFRRTRRGRAVSQILALALLAFLAVRLWRLWSSTDLSLRDVRPGVAVAAVVVSTIAVVSYGCVWPVVLDRLGIEAQARQLMLFLKSQLGKYLPGSVWQFAGRIGLGRGEGIPANIGLASIAVEVAASLFAAVVVGGLVLSLWAGLVVAAAAAVATAATIRRHGWISRLAGSVPRLDARLVARAARVIPLATPLYGVVWVVYGTAFWLTARALFVVPASDVPLYIGVFALSWAVGFVAIFAPGGVGVREAVIVGLLVGHLGEAKAIVLAGASRIVLTTIDLALGAVAIVATGRHAPHIRELEARR